MMATKYFACDPTVVGVQLFLLVDEKYRNGRDENGHDVGGGWQSGLLTAGGEGVSAPKRAYARSAPLFAAGRAACTGRRSLVAVEVGRPRGGPKAEPKPARRRRRSTSSRRRRTQH